MHPVWVRDMAARLVSATAVRCRPRPLGMRCKQHFRAPMRVARITAHQASAQGTRCKRRFRTLMLAAPITARRVSLRVDSLSRFESPCHGPGLLVFRTRRRFSSRASRPACSVSWWYRKAPRNVAANRHISAIAGTHRRPNNRSACNRRRAHEARRESWRPWKFDPQASAGRTIAVDPSAKTLLIQDKTE